MHFLFFLILCHFLESRSAIPLPWREIDRFERYEARRRFQWVQLAPDSIGKASKKFLVPYGDAEDVVDTIIESIPVPNRIVGLTKLGGVLTREDAFLMLDSIGLDKSIKEYVGNLIGNMFLELGLIDKFIKFAYARELAIPRNAVSFVKYMREYSEQHFGHSMKFFSPRMLIDWLTIFKQGGLFRIEIPGHRYDSDTSAKHLPPKTLMNLEIGVWKQLLINRLNRLSLT